MSVLFKQLEKTDGENMFEDYVKLEGIQFDPFFSFLSHYNSLYECVCPCWSVTQVHLCVCVWPDIGEKQHCVSYSPPSVAEKEKNNKVVL